MRLRHIEVFNAVMLTGSVTGAARLINVTDLAGPFQLTRQTIHDYVTVLERVFLLERLPPWHSTG